MSENPQQVASEAPSLQEVLALVPAGTDIFSYSNAASIKEERGLDDLAERDFYEQQEVIFELRGQGLLLGLYPSWKFPRHEQLWGWDVGDVVWDMQVVGPGTSYFVGLGRDFDYAGLEALLEERKYARDEAFGFPVYSHDYDIYEPWLVDKYGASSPRDVLNIGIIEGEGVALAPSLGSLESLLAVRDGAPSLADQRVISDAVAELEEPLFAVVRRTGERGCAGMWPRLLRGRQRRQLERVYAGFTHEVLAAGIFFEGDERSGRAVIGYASPSSARADLDLRRRAAKGGISLNTYDLYREDHFMYRGIDVLGSNIVLTVGPAASDRLAIVAMLYGQDLLFAAC